MGFSSKAVPHRESFTFALIRLTVTTPFVAMAAIALAVFAQPRLSFAMGDVGIDSSGFLRESGQRPDSSSFVVVGPRFETQGKIVETNVDLKAYAFLQSSASITAEAKNLYVATSRSLVPGNQLTIGRRVYDWSTADEVWNMGLWQPRFNWDPLRPIQVGLTGAFYTYETSEFRFLAFASPMAIPERGSSLYISNGQITSPSVWFKPLPKEVQLTIGGTTTTVPINYSIQYPTISESVFRPGAGVQARFGGRTRFWGALAYGVLPANQIDEAADVKLKQAQYVNATVYPRFLVHQLLTAEAGYRGKFWSVFGSLNGESPIGASRSVSPDWLYTPVGPALISAWGGSLSWREGLKVTASYLSVLEKPAARPTLTDIDISFPSRFNYTKAALIQATWQNRTDFSYALGWTYDIAYDSGLASANVFYRPGFSVAPESSTLTFNIGADFISSTTGKGYIGQYVGNDRMRGGIAYAF